MPILKNIGTLASCRLDGKQNDIHAISNAALAWREGIIHWVGSETDLPERFRTWEHLDAQGKLVVPGLVDCHTHLVFGGWRSDEFEARIQGRSYHEIAKGGGGIARTVASTRNSSDEELLSKARRALDDMAAAGVTTVECKSGYGLRLEDELRVLRIYKLLSETQPLRIVSTFLGAHTVPIEYKTDKTRYLNIVQHEMIPAVREENLAEFCDVFVDDTAFTVDEARAVLETGKTFGLQPKLHADQLSDGGAAKLAGEVQAISADHLEYISVEGADALREADVVAVSLPLASFYLKQPPIPARRLMESGIPVAVATDYNPGSAPTCNLPLAMLMGSVLQGMTPAEVLKGATVYAAKAIGREQEIGSLEKGKAADFLLVDATSINQWISNFRPQAILATVVGGEQIGSGMQKLVPKHITSKCTEHHVMNEESHDETP